MMEPLILTEPLPSSELSVASFARFVRQYWKFFLFLPALTFLMGVVLLHVLDSKYTASLLVTPVQKGEPGLAGLGGIAAMAGVNLSGAGDQNDFALYRASIVSREVATLLSQDKHLLKRIFPREWSESTNSWTAPERPLKFIIDPVKFILGIPERQWQEPGPARMQDFLVKELAFSEQKDSPIVVISLEMEDPVLAIIILKRLHELSDNLLKDRAQRRAIGNIEHLSSELGKTTLIERRAAIASILVDQENSLMLARSGQPFAAYPFDGPVVLINPTSPRPLLVLALSLAAGIGLALAASLLRDALSVS